MIDVPFFCLKIETAPIEIKPLIMKNLNLLMDIVGYRFNFPQYLFMALVHPSFIEPMFDIFIGDN